jgi:hypothetical protein
VKQTPAGNPARAGDPRVRMVTRAEPEPDLRDHACGGLKRPWVGIRSAGPLCCG